MIATRARASPTTLHRCYAEVRPAPRALAHQEAYCLSSAFPVCPTFQAWARREAAQARSAASASAAAAGVAGAAGRDAGGEDPRSRRCRRPPPDVGDASPPLPDEPDEHRTTDPEPPRDPNEPPVRRNPPRDWAAPPPWAAGAAGASAAARRANRPTSSPAAAPKGRASPVAPPIASRVADRSTICGHSHGRSPRTRRPRRGSGAGRPRRWRGGRRSVRVGAGRPADTPGQATRCEFDARQAGRPNARADRPSLGEGPPLRGVSHDQDADGHARRPARRRPGGCARDRRARAVLPPGAPGYRRWRRHRLEHLTKCLDSGRDTVGRARRLRRRRRRRSTSSYRATRSRRSRTSSA